MIGIFDSGIGGLTVVKSLMEKLPGYNMIYFGDTARTPYGSKSPETVVRYALENTDFLLIQGAKLIVMACNTASSVAAGRIAENYDIPIFEVVTPATERAVKTSNTLIIGVIGTRATVKSGIYEHKIMALKPDAKVYSVACPLLVPNSDDHKKISASIKSQTDRHADSGMHPLPPFKRQNPKKNWKKGPYHRLFNRHCRKRKILFGYAS